MSSNFTGNENISLPEEYIIPDDLEQKDLKLREYLNAISSSVNTKTYGLYDSEETVTGNRFLPTFNSETSSNTKYRSVFRKTIDTGALPLSSIKLIPHGIPITADYTFVKIYGCATIPGTNAIPLPFASPSGTDQVQLFVEIGNIRIVTNSNNYSLYTRSFVIVEYITEL